LACSTTAHDPPHGLGHGELVASRSPLHSYHYANECFPGEPLHRPELPTEYFLSQLSRSGFFSRFPRETRWQLETAMKGHILAHTEPVGTHQQQ